MTRCTTCFAVLALLLALGCGETATGTGGTAGSGGTAGTGGAPPPPPPTVDQTCRDWCANEPEGFSCHQGSVESVQDCYENCLRDYQSEAERQCGDEWIALKDCQLDLDCEDLFGDCDSTKGAYDECVQTANNRAFCETNCPELDIIRCEQEAMLCPAHQFCEATCPTQDPVQCVAQYMETGTCEYREATDSCREYCAAQILSECVDEWIATGMCQFDDGAAACRALCPNYRPESYCAEYWEENGVCPDGPPPLEMPCGEGESIDDSFTTGVGAVACDALGVISIPIGVTLAARPMGPIAGETDFEVRAQQTLDEDTVGDLGALVQRATIGESWTDVDEIGGSDPVKVAATVPCQVDFSDDPDDNGSPGPVVIATPVATSAWTAIDGSIVLEAVDMTFTISQPVPLTLSTTGADPACVWVMRPRVTFEGP